MSLMLQLGIVAIVMGFGCLLFVIFYNTLVRLKSLKEEAWSGIEVQLKRRHDLIDHLLHGLGGAMEPQAAPLAQVAHCRQRIDQAGSVAETSKAEQELDRALAKLFATMNESATLTMAQNVLQLQKTLTALEEDLEKARRYYNGCVREFNIRIESFPSLLVAQALHLSKAEYFEADESTTHGA
ncbi:MAG: LemA family protein [Desulfovibrio sp.]|nr:LemA family protein [Desulfovibrio sp.]